MVIQRIQTLFLIMGVVLMAVFVMLPFADLGVGDNVVAVQKIFDYPVYAVLNILIGVLLLVDIFLYKNLKLQKLVAKISMLLILGSIIALVCILLFTDPAGLSVLSVSVMSFLALVFTMILTYAAYRGISRDIHTLNSYDRLR